MKQYNGEKYIVSFTSFGKRVPLIGKVIFALRKQTYKDFHLVLTLYKEDLKFIDETIQMMIDSNLLEVITADKDYGPHLKYYYAMKKYYDKPIITVDDDRYYSVNTIKFLVEKYESLDYKSIVSNCAIKIQKKNERILPYPNWIPYRLDPNEKSIFAMAEGFAGVLYPPKCFPDLTNDNFIKGILECKYDDDLYLKVKEIEHNIPTTQCNYKPNYSERNNIQELMKYNLHNNQNANNTNRINLCYKFEKELLEAWRK